ncbi:MAG: hypothetical protein U5R48_11955 [Gammaproteobacteria bacterium]|nr:hypothetical protein [Gammaproteobacteria bacterium]
MLPFKTDLDMYSVFGEVQDPALRHLDVQGGSRCGLRRRGELTPSIRRRSPSLAGHGQAHRAHVHGQLVRAPGLNQLWCRTACSSLRNGNTFKAAIEPPPGDPGLSPEESINFNFGLIWEPTANVLRDPGLLDFDYSIRSISEQADIRRRSRRSRCRRWSATSPWAS